MTTLQIAFIYTIFVLPLAVLLGKFIKGGA